MWMGRQNELLPTSYASQHSEHTITGFEPQSSLSTMASTEAATVASAIAPQVGAIIPAPPPLTMASSISAQLQAAGKSMSSPRPEVVCPLPNPDGSGCRKKCSGVCAFFFENRPHRLDTQFTHLLNFEMFSQKTLNYRGHTNMHIHIHTHFDCATHVPHIPFDLYCKMNSYQLLTVASYRHLRTEAFASTFAELIPTTGFPGCQPVQRVSEK